MLSLLSIEQNLVDTGVPSFVNTLRPVSWKNIIPGCFGEYMDTDSSSMYNDNSLLTSIEISDGL